MVPRRLGALNRVRIIPQLERDIGYRWRISAFRYTGVLDIALCNLNYRYHDRPSIARF